MKEKVMAKTRPCNPEALVRMKTITTARIGAGRVGSRLRTETLLKLREDHAAARDTVLRNVDPELLLRLGLYQLQSRCRSREEHITRPDLGRRLCEESKAAVLTMCEKNVDVQIIVSDGLSSKAIEANTENILGILSDGLAARGIRVGRTFFVRYGRVAIEDEVSEILHAKLVCILIGERPGLGTAESMSAYICYNAKMGQTESRRTVVSNIHAKGIPAVEAGAYIVDLVEKMLQQKASGLELKRV
jgi:ethanolamine ammonia-lyase small subunit